MTGREKALNRAWCHERRRQGRTERAAIGSLNDAELIRLVRGLNAVERAVDHRLNVLDQERAA